MENEKVSFGWMPDMPDFRDYTAESPEIQDLLASTGIKVDNTAHKGVTAAAKGKEKPLTLPASVDLRAYCSPIENQGALGSCTANAGVGMIEYYQRRAFNTYLDGSRLFLYKVTRNLLKWTGDTGAYLRSTMKALAGFGVCPEEYWPYSATKTGQNGSPNDPFEKEPSSFCYAFAGNFKSLSYFRLDTPGLAPAALVDRIKSYANAGLPSMFGFTVYSSYSQSTATGKLPYPNAGESVVGGHAVMIVGYDDSIQIKNGTAAATTGAFLIRNSWGTGWGMQGYGYLPYKYVLNAQASDFWTIASASFFNTGNFG